MKLKKLPDDVVVLAEIVSLSLHYLEIVLI
jgi:hypothetical protein